MLCALSLLILPIVPWVKKKREAIGEMGEEE
jgi:competence protein ComGC